MAARPGKPRQTQVPVVVTLSSRDQLRRVRFITVVSGTLGQREPFEVVRVIPATQNGGLEKMPR